MVKLDILAGKTKKLKLVVDSKTQDHFILLQDNSSLDLEFVAFGDIDGQFNLVIDVAGQGANAKVFGAAVLNGRSNFRVNIEQNHLAPNSGSDVVVRTVVDDKSSFDYRGMIYIAEGATGTVANQENKNILMSDDANAVSIPSIEVLTDDVQCGHGSATGKIDEEQLYYLMSRGVSKEGATDILLKSFLGIKDLFVEPQSCCGH